MGRPGRVNTLRDVGRGYVGQSCKTMHWHDKKRLSHWRRVQDTRDDDRYIPVSRLTVGPQNDVFFYTPKHQSCISKPIPQPINHNITKLDVIH